MLSLYRLSVAVFTVFCCLDGADAASSASKLIAQAAKIPTGSYYLENGNGQRIFSGSSKSFHLAKGSGSKISVTAYKGKTHIVGASRKCLSAAWDAKLHANGMGQLYACVVPGKKRGTLKADKQQWLFVPAEGKSRRRDLQDMVKRWFSSDVDVEEDDAITDELALPALDEAGLEDLETEALVESDDGSEVEDEGLGPFDRLVKRARRKAKKSKAKKAKKPKKKAAKKDKRYGPYHIVSMDHITNQPPRSLSAKPVKSLSQTVCSIKALSKATKQDQWYFISA